MGGVAALSFFGGIEYARRSEGSLRLDVLAPPDAHGLPVALYFHGGGWREGDRGAAMHPWLNPLLAASGFVCVSATYRLSGVAPWPAQRVDALAAVEWVAGHTAEIGADPGRIGVYGFSAGAHLAALVALQPGTPVRAAAVAAVPADLRRIDPFGPNEVTELFGRRPSPRDLADASPLTYAHRAAPPFLIVHGTRDEVVPYEQGLALRDALRAGGTDVEWHGIEGGTHEWADRPLAGLDESQAGFGGLVRDFFTRTLVDG